MNKPAIFLDRDGTINTLNGYVSRYEQIQIMDGVPEAIKIFNKLGYLVIVITNQPVIEMGLVSEKNLEDIHMKIKSEINKKGGRIDAFFYCPHLEADRANNPERKNSCSCRKPQTGLILDAMVAYQIDLPNSYMVGDSWRDVELAKNLGIKYFQIIDRSISHGNSSECVNSLLESALIIEKLKIANVKLNNV
jgi:mannose-1-phosphate guanylyltransferase/phosphomannomutase